MKCSFGRETFSIFGILAQNLAAMKSTMLIASIVFMIIVFLIFRQLKAILLESLKPDGASNESCSYTSDVVDRDHGLQLAGVVGAG